jgi:hypothetical protein
VRLQNGLPLLTGTDADRLLDWEHEDLAAPDRACLRIASSTNSCCRPDPLMKASIFFIERIL